MTNSFYAAVLMAIIPSCAKSTLPPEPPYTETVTDAGLPAADPMSTQACMNLQAFGCPEGGPSPKGVACPLWMSAARGYVDVACIANAKSKTELIANCNVRCTY